MADDKKPKIDLKARLGKTAAGGATPPPPAAGGGLPMPGPAAAIPAPAGSAGSGSYAPSAVPTPGAMNPAGGLPVPPGIPVGPPPAFKSPAMSLDPSNPLAAAMAQPAPARTHAPAPPPQPQRIEVDELTVQEARKGARKQGLMAGIVFGVVLAAVGYIAGGAQETNKGRSQSVAHAKSLAGDVEKARGQLKDLGDKLEAGRDVLAKEKKFPDALARDLSAINVDFDGTKLAGVRFSGFSQETTSGLIEFISNVQATNDRKNALSSLLTKLQKPMTEMLAAQASGKPPPVTFVVLVDKDSAKNPFAVLAPLQKPIELSASMPAEFTATDPRRKANVTAPKLTSLDKPGAAYVVPQSIDAAFPSETAGQVGQLVSQLSRLLSDVRGEAPAAGEAISEPKPGLLERADTLVTNLNKVK
ncbi:MAG: hypothetical protein KF894_24470 [Labilithrix sp.]|nr:hypothetical protein [Labilithrix sp.]